TNLLVYLLGENDYLKAFSIKDSKQIVTPPVATSFYHLPPGMPGGTLSVSSSPTDPMSGILWATVPLKDDAVENIVEGRLLAFQAVPSGNKLKVLWDSQSNPGRD